MAIRFLIDECLHDSLPARAHAKHYAAAHVAHVGLGGAADAHLLRRLLAEDEVLCTNNARDFAGVLGEREVHPGLVVFEENTFTEVEEKQEILDRLEPQLREVERPPL